MRKITTHEVNTLNECIVIEALAEPEASGAHTSYRISGKKGPLDNHPIPTIDLRFQNGPIKECGANGITHECLLAVLIDRLDGFQHGPFQCQENAIALERLMAARDILKSRTIVRQHRGVEGTHEV